MIARETAPMPDKMLEKTRADLQHVIQELKKRLRDQERQLARLSKTTPNPRKTSRISRPAKESWVPADLFAWFAGSLVPSLGVPVIVVVADKGGLVRSFLGDPARLPPEDRIGTPCESLIVTEDRARWRTYWRNLDDAYKRLHLSFRVRPEIAEGMVAQAFRSPGSDVTWLVLHGRPLGATSDADDPVKRWAGIFAHELNQPLASVLTTAQACRSLLSSGKLLPEEMAQGMEALIRRGHYAADVVRHLRTLAGGEPPRRVPADLREIVRRGLDLLQGPIDDTKTKVTLAFDPNLPEVRIDSVQMVQVVVNLVRNAIEAGSSLPAARRQVTVRTRSESREGSRENPPEAVVSVEDQGVGLSVDVIQRLFQPIASTKSAGMGLGLALCRQIVEAHGGRIWAKANSSKGSEPRGCTFSFSVPFSTEEP